jgi:hypothetical protein
MDPRFLLPEHWNQLSVLVAHLILFVGLVINTALAFLLAHGIIPSLVSNALATSDTLALRRVLYPVFVVSGLLAALAFGRAIYLFIELVNYFYPRFAI